MNFQNEMPAVRSNLYPVQVLLLLLLACMMGVLVGGALAYAWVTTQGLDLQDLIYTLNEQSSLAQRNAVRMANLLNHLSSFSIPAILVAWFAYRRDALSFLRLRSPLPEGKMVVASIFFVLASFPFIQIVIWINQQIPLPDWMTQSDHATEEMVKGLLVMNSPTELIFNLLIIAILPAIGEELVFRGILQQQLEKLWQRPVLAIWATALTFGAVHLQMERVLALSVLGAALGYTFYWTRSLWIPILGHFLINGLQVVGQYVTKGKLTEENVLKLEWTDWVGGFASLFITIGIGYYLWSNTKNKPEIAAKEP